MTESLLTKFYSADIYYICEKLFSVLIALVLIYGYN